MVRYLRCVCCARFVDSRIAARYHRKRKRMSIDCLFFTITILICKMLATISCIDRHWCAYYWPNKHTSKQTNNWILVFCVKIFLKNLILGCESVVASRLETCSWCRLYGWQWSQGNNITCFVTQFCNFAIYFLSDYNRLWSNEMPQVNLAGDK